MEASREKRQEDRGVSKEGGRGDRPSPFGPSLNTAKGPQQMDPVMSEGLSGKPKSHSSVFRGPKSCFGGPRRQSWGAKRWSWGSSRVGLGVFSSIGLGAAKSWLQGPSKVGVSVPKSLLWGRGGSRGRQTGQIPQTPRFCRFPLKMHRFHDVGPHPLFPKPLVWI